MSRLIGLGDEQRKEFINYIDSIYRCLRSSVSLDKRTGSIDYEVVTSGRERSSKKGRCYTGNDNDDISTHTIERASRDFLGVMTSHDTLGDQVRLERSFIKDTVRESLRELCGNIDKQPRKSEHNTMDTKELRNLLKNIANLVSYMMKTSSIFTNFAALFCKKGTGSTSAVDRRPQIKEVSVKFSEDIFERHRLLVKLIKNFETNQNRSDMVPINLLVSFSRKVSEAGKQELSCIESYLSSIIELIGKE